MDGISGETDLVTDWSPKGENLLWMKEDCASRCTPVIMNGKLYMVTRSNPESTEEGERTVCLDAETGEMLWESVHNVFLSDAPAERVGWSSVIADAESGNVYVLGLGCLFQCLNGETGEVIWEHSLSEEYGWLSTYGGRTNFPTVFEDLVIISGVTIGWGDTAIPAHRFVAFDKYTGAATWMKSTRLKPDDTTYSTPTLTQFDGQDAIVFAAGDGAIYALQPRTGKEIWKYQASNRGINTSPIVKDGIVYCGHSEQNTANPNILGAFFAFDGRTEGQIKEEDLLWKVPGITIGRSSPIKIGDRIYAVEDGAKLIILQADTGDLIDEVKLGRIMFGSLLYADGKIYVGESTGRYVVLEPTDEGVKKLTQVRLNAGEEIHASPIVSGGRIYLVTNTALYCIGKETPNDVSAAPDAIEAFPAEAVSDTTITQLQLAPVEMILKPGQTIPMQVRGYNALGQFVGMVPDCEIATDANCTIEKSETPGFWKVTAPSDVNNAAAVILTATQGEMTAEARARVFSDLPWSFDFESGEVPLPWVGVRYRHQAKEIDGENCLVKVSTIPKGARSQAWIGPTDLSDYTVQADVRGTARGTQLPDMGLVNQRYTLDLQGSQRLQIRSWTPRLELRFAKTMDFDWEAGVWYTIKFQAENVDNGVTLRGKVWKREEAEPAEWQIEATDGLPSQHGSPGLFGNAQDTEFYLDNLKVYPNSMEETAEENVEAPAGSDAP
jgi:outer membrane protein assembly factor BamB